MPRCILSAILWLPLCNVAGRETRQTGDGRPVGIRHDAADHRLWSPTFRCRCSCAIRSMAQLRGEMHPNEHGYAMPPCADRGESRDGPGGHKAGLQGHPNMRQGGSLARPSDDSRARRDQAGVPDRSRRCRGDRGGRGAGEASLACRKRRPATPLAPNKRPPAHVARHAGVAASDGKATASLGLHAAMRVRIVLVEGRRIAQQN